MIKNWLMIIITVLLLSCSSSKKTETIKIGVSSNYFPFNYIDSEKNVAGFEIDMINAFCTKYHYQPEYIQENIPHLFKALKAKELDFIVASLTLTEERKKIFSVSEPYFNANQLIVSLPDSAYQIQSIDDLSPYKIGLLKGSSSQFLMDQVLQEQDNFKAKRIFRSKNYNELLDLLSEKKVDMAFVDQSFFDYFQKDYQLSSVHSIPTNEMFCVYMPKDTHIKSKWNRFIKKFKKSKEYKELLKKHFLETEEKA